MFGLNKSSKDDAKKMAPEAVHDIGVIPDIFYGGSDPDIYAEKAEKKVEHVPAAKIDEKSKEPTKEPIIPRVAPPRRLPPPPLPASGSQAVAPVVAPAPAAAPGMQQPAPPMKKSHTGILLVVIFLLLIAGGAAAWFFLFRPKVLPPQDVVENTVPEVVANPPIIEPIPVVTSTVVSSTIPEIPSIPTSTLIRERSLPLLSIFTTPDTDSDKLSAAEEETFQVDPEVWDTDSDGYYDGQEVYNLYNPKGLAPMRIIDSGLVAEYINPTWQYRVYYPLTWQATPIDARNNKEVLFNADSGDYVEIKTYDKLPGESFPGWFGRVVSDQIYTDVVQQKNRFQVPYYRRKDGLVSYVETDKQVYILILYSRTEGNNDFVHVIDMMAQSFRPGKVSPELPPQPILPIPGQVLPSPTTSSLPRETSSASSTSSTLR